MKKVALAVLAIVVFLAGAYWILFPTHSYRYRLTIAAEVDDKLVRASSVIEVSMTKQPQFVAHVPAYHTEVSGDAIFLDLGNGRNVVALLAFGPTGSAGHLQFLAPAVFDATPKEIWENLSQTDEQRTLRGDDIPTLVKFADVNDPASGRVVKPEDLPKVFGEDVRFIGAQIQMTRDPVTRGLESLLPMLVTHKEFMSKLNGHAQHFVPQYHLFIRN